MSEQVLLLCDLCKQHSKLVADVAQSIVVGALAPFAELSSNGGTLFGSCLVGVNSMVLRLDELVEALGQLRLVATTQGCEGEVRFAGGIAGIVAAL